MRTLPPAIRQVLPLLLALCAGALLGLPRAFPDFAPLQIVGFAAFFLLAHGCVKLRDAVKFGALAGLASAITALAFVHVHFAAAVALLVSLTFNHALFGALLLLLLRHGAFGAFVAGAGLITLGEWGFAHLLPIFGTAQYTTCAWSAWPGLVRHEAVLGACGTLLGVTLLGACAAGLCLRKDRVRALICLICVVLAFAWQNGRGRNMTTFNLERTSMRVAAAVGDVFLSPPEARQAYAPLVAEAAGQGAELVVLPELTVQDNGTGETTEVFGGLARTHGITLVVGLFDKGPDHAVNCALAFGPDGTLLATHTKAHHIPFMENYTRKGDAAQPSLITPPGRYPAGLLICQDDNFTDLANASAKAGAQVLAVPTLDWPGVETAHFTNSRHRALETGLPLIRAAHGGICAIFDADGAVLARRDHAKEGDGLIVADVLVPPGKIKGPTPFVRFGDLPVLLLSALTVALGLWFMRGKTVPAPAVA